MEEMDENIRHEAELIAGSLGCDMKQLGREPLKIILQRMNTDYSNEEQFELIKRFAEAGVIPEHYIDEAHALLFSQP